MKAPVKKGRRRGEHLMQRHGSGAVVGVFGGRHLADGSWLARYGAHLAVRGRRSLFSCCFHSRERRHDRRVRALLVLHGCIELELRGWVEQPRSGGKAVAIEGDGPRTVFEGPREREFVRIRVAQAQKHRRIEGRVLDVRLDHPQTPDEGDNQRGSSEGVIRGPS